MGSPAGTVMHEDSLPGIHRLQAGAEGGASVGGKVPLRNCLLWVLTISHELSGSGTPLQLLTGHLPHCDGRGGCRWVLGHCGLPRGALSQGHWRRRGAFLLPACEEGLAAPAGPTVLSVSSYFLSPNPRVPIALTFLMTSSFGIASLTPSPSRA